MLQVMTVRDERGEKQKMIESRGVYAYHLHQGYTDNVVQVYTCTVLILLSMIGVVESLRDATQSSL